MTTITLKPDVAEQIRYLVNLSGEDVDNNTIVDRALRRYLAEFRREKVRKELQAFQQQRQTVLINYPGEYVAIHQGQVIDHDVDLRTLHLRIFDQLGHTLVLLKQVNPEPERELVFRTPRFERNPS
jgi:hypothetical protein